MKTTGESARHPSELALEQHLLDPQASPHAAHVAGCARCGGRLAQMRAEGDEFRARVYPATLEQVLKPRSAPERAFPQHRLLRVFAAVSVPVLAAAALLVAVRRGPDADYVGTKGAGFGFAAFVGGASGARALGDGEAVAPGAALRFRVRGAGACSLFIVSIDDAGQLSRIAPEQGEEGLRGAPATLPGGAVLDDREGPERLFALCTKAGVPFSRIAEAARKITVRGAADVRTLNALPGLPEGTAQATLLVEKKR